METDKLFYEARARIIWGDSLQSVRHFLVSNGISSTIADSKIEEFLLEKSVQLKKDGIKEILSGVTLLAASGGVLLCIIFAGGLGWPTFFVRSGGILVCIGLYGVWKLINGFILLVQSANGRNRIRIKIADSPKDDEFDIGVDNNQAAKIENANYSILGLTPPCSLDDVKTAYRQRMKECHPDRFTSETLEFRQWAEERAKVVNAAYETLLNEL